MSKKFVLISKDPTNLETEKQIEILRHKVIDSNDPHDMQEFYKACSKWFQERHMRAMVEFDYLKSKCANEGVCHD